MVSIKAVDIFGKRGKATVVARLKFLSKKNEKNFCLNKSKLAVSNHVIPVLVLMMARHRVVELSTWFLDPKARPRVVATETKIASKKKKGVGSPRKNRNQLSPRKQYAPTANEQAAGRIAVCHQMNSLFRAQGSFADAEQLAKEFYEHTALLKDHQEDESPSLLFLEGLLDVLEEAGPMAHVPCEVLANFALDNHYRQLILQTEAVDMTHALLLAARHQDGGSSALLTSVAQDFIDDMSN